MTHSYICTVVVMIWRDMLYVLNVASQKSATGCLPTESSWTPTKLSRWCITAFITRLPDTWRTTVFRSLMWPVDDIFVLPGVITSLCLDTVSARMGVSHMLLPAQLPGTHWAMICVIRRLALTVSDVCLKLRCFESTSTYSALEVLYLSAILIHDLLTYALTYILLLTAVTSSKPASLRDLTARLAADGKLLVS